jgi:hypothetical protein
VGYSEIPAYHESDGVCVKTQKLFGKMYVYRKTC